MKTIFPKNSNLRLVAVVIFFTLFTCYVSNAQSVGVNQATPEAQLHIGPGTTAVHTAPLKLTDGPLLTTPEPGAIEYKGHTFYATTDLVRRSIVLAQNVVMADVPVTNTQTETTVYTVTMPPNYLTAGKMINIKLFGNYRTNGLLNTFTCTVKESSNGNTLFSTVSTSVTTGATLRAHSIDLSLTIRDINGTTTPIRGLAVITQDKTASSMTYNNTSTFNTTVTNTITVTIQWNNASPNNQFNLLGGATTCVDANN